MMNRFVQTCLFLAFFFCGLQAGVLKIAACQFPVSENIEENSYWIKEQMREAKTQGADIVHFPECALSGYAGVDFDSFDEFDWPLLGNEFRAILALADELDIWVILGSSHRLTDAHKPHNSLYLINPEGHIADRYDKRFCTEGDLKYYSPGDHFVTFEINQIKCGILICYDIRFPELYRAYYQLGVEVIFQSFYNARQKETSIHPKIMPVTAQARAATNHFFISLTNSSAKHSWPCHMITPDGLIAEKLPANKPGILVFTIDSGKKYYDASKPFRERAIEGILNSGETVSDPRSQNRQEY
jgi:predicted amidohydrolase